MKSPTKLIVSALALLGVTCCQQALALENHWLVRARGIDVVPTVSSNTINVIGGQVTNISSAFVPELDISYFITPHIATELILGTSRHSVKATGTALNDVDLGKVSLLPPTLTLQYHFLPTQTIDPYVGAGINYTAFYNVDNGPVADSISYKNSFGPALQAGLDIAINRNWVVNFDVKKVFIKTTATVNALGQNLTADVNIDPVIYGFGIGYHFC